MAQLPEWMSQFMPGRAQERAPMVGGLSGAANQMMNPDANAMDERNLYSGFAPYGEEFTEEELAAMPVGGMSGLLKYLNNPQQDPSAMLASQRDLGRMSHMMPGGLRRHMQDRMMTNNPYRGIDAGDMPERDVNVPGVERQMYTSPGGGSSGYNESIPNPSDYGDFSGGSRY